jgi:hypothetical protein
MKKSNFILAIVIIILITALILRIKESLEKKEAIVLEEEKPKEIIVDYVKPETEPIKIIQPLENELVSSPLEVKGMIPANWLLETSYYVVLTDNENQSIIDVSKFETEKDWDTMEMVPFFSILEFSDFSGQGTISIREMKNNHLIYVDEAEEILINYLNE